MLIIDTGATRYGDDVRLWAWLNLPDRDDKLLCLALVLESAPKPAASRQAPCGG